MTKPEMVLSRKLLRPPVRTKISAKIRWLCDCLMAWMSQRKRVISRARERIISRGAGMSKRNKLGFF